MSTKQVDPFYGAFHLVESNMMLTHTYTHNTQDTTVYPFPLVQVTGKTVLQCALCVYAYF
ncbi:hypothetical protein L1N85_17100 [Paenibacillus alkaliterrae]|uniref:hypothetical protein n=1 Tax=Paenibacillus alkaliterrae TaxID=320909 RepID=UPI001F1FF9A4|nr:hypothetical protein [Paenibacillus alkaliterrae]MCF2940125.1 hypothetical protein [Paenibacillus alkaliterrae]